MAPPGALPELHASSETARSEDQSLRRLVRAICTRAMPDAGQIDLQAGSKSWQRLEPRLSDLFLALEPANGALCYLLARSLRARQIVEFGTCCHAAAPFAEAHVPAPGRAGRAKRAASA